MIGAVIKEDIVENVIVLDESQIEEMRKALGADEIIDARPYGLNIGDLRTAAGWTRNAGGEQMVLPLLEPEQYDSYTVAMKKVDEAEAQVEYAGEAAAYEALAILTGEVEENE